MWSPRTSSPRPTAPTAAPTWGASPERCPAPNTSTAWRLSGSSTPTSRSPTRLLPACTRPSSAPPNPAWAESSPMSEKPSVLFVCVHNAGRSQMAAGYLRALAGDRVDVLSAGSLPADRVNPVAVEAMAEVGIDIVGEEPKILTTDAVRASDVVITMGCGDVCPVFPGKRYEDWTLDDPAGLPLEEVRPIRDDIRRRVAHLLTELGVDAETGST